MCRLAIIAYCLCTTLSSGQAEADSSPAVPRPGRHQFVCDYAGVLGPDEVEAIRRIANELFTNQSVPVFVVTVPSAGSRPLSAYARELLSRWAEQAEQDEPARWKVPWGRTILILADKAAGRGHVEFGTRWGRQVDADRHHVMETLIVPQFGAGEFGAGLLAGLQSLAAMIPNHPGPVVDEALPAPRDTDRVVLKDGSVLTGLVLNETYRLATRFGNITFPAARLQGLLAKGKTGSGVRLALKDGQVFSGLLIGQKLRLARSIEDVREIPVRRLRSLTLRSASETPSPLPDRAAVIEVDGDRVALQADDLDLTLQTAHGRITLPPEAVTRIEAIGRGAEHRVTFRNGSVLTGVLGPNRIALQLKTGGPATLEAREVRRLLWPDRQVKRPLGATTVVLRGIDRVVGRMTKESLSIKATLGAVEIKTGDIVSLTSSPIDIGLATAKLSAERVIRGRVLDASINMDGEAEGPAVPVRVNQILAIVTPNALAETTPKPLAKADE